MGIRRKKAKTGLPPETKPRRNDGVADDCFTLDDNEAGCVTGKLKARGIRVHEKYTNTAKPEAEALVTAAEYAERSDAYIDYAYPKVKRCLVLLAIQVVLPSLIHVVTSAKGPVTLTGWLYQASLFNLLAYKYHRLTCRPTSEMYQLFSLYFYIVTMFLWISFIVAWQPVNRVLDYLVFKYKLPCYKYSNIVLEVTWKALACVWYLSSLYSCGLIGNYWIDNSKSKQEARGKRIGDASDCPGGQFTRDECRKDEECGKIENQQGTRYNRTSRKSFASRGISRKTQRKRANNTIMNACDY